MKKESLTIILACYNEGPTFGSSVRKIISELKRAKRPWGIIFVDDKSVDDTKLAVEEFVKNNKNCRAIYHSKNQGRGKSVCDGIKIAKGEICGFMDVDCEIAPSYIPLFTEEIVKGADVAVGQRFYEKGWKSLNRVVASKVYAILVGTVLDLPISDTEAGFKFFNRRNILKILPKVKNSGWFWDTEICARAYWTGLRVSEIPVLFNKRKEKKSTVKLIPDSLDYLVQLFKFRSEKPVKV